MVPKSLTRGISLPTQFTNFRLIPFSQSRCSSHWRSSLPRETRDPLCSCSLVQDAPFVDATRARDAAVRARDRVLGSRGSRRCGARRGGKRGASKLVRLLGGAGQELEKPSAKGRRVNTTTTAVFGTPCFRMNVSAQGCNPLSHRSLAPCRFSLRD